MHIRKVKIVLFLYLLVAPMVTSAQIKAIRPFSRVRAIVVGVSDYQDPAIADLAYADDDATAFARLLREETAWRVAPDDMVLLTNEAATYERFMAELNRVVETAAPKERLVLYFAGHGDVEVVSERKTGFLLFHNATPTTYAIGGACEVNTLDEALNRLVLEKEAEVLLITDACRSGELAGSLAGS
ncbi:MAG: caspase family protein, partial [Bacteroidota bacterium]